MRFAIALLLDLALVLALHFAIQSITPSLPKASPDLPEAELATALEQRAVLLDSPGLLGVLLPDPLVKTNAEVAQKIRRKVRSPMGESSPSYTRWFRKQNLSESDRQLAFVATELRDLEMRWWIAAVLAPLAVMCFAFHAPDWTPRARGSIISLGLLCVLGLFATVRWNLAHALVVLLMVVMSVAVWIVFGALVREKPLG